MRGSGRTFPDGSASSAAPGTVAFAGGASPVPVLASRGGTRRTSLPWSRGSSQEWVCSVDGKPAGHLSPAGSPGSDPLNDQVYDVRVEHLAEPDWGLPGRGAGRRSGQYDDDVGFTTGQQARAESYVGESLEAVDQLLELTLMVGGWVADDIATTAIAADRDRTPVTVCTHRPWGGFTCGRRVPRPAGCAHASCDARARR